MNQTKQKPAYGSPSWYLDLLQIVRKKLPDKIDLGFLKMYGIGSGNESKVLAGLRFLRLIDGEGNPTQLMQRLRTLSDEDFRRALEEVVKSAYQDLFEKLVFEKITFDKLVTYFMQSYELSQAVATQAARCFITFCEMAGISLPHEIHSTSKVKSSISIRGDKPLEKIREHGKKESIEPFEKEVLSWGPILIQLPKNDIVAAERAKKMIELYIEELKARSGGGRGEGD